MKNFLPFIFSVLTSFGLFAQQVNINPSMLHFHLGNTGANETKSIIITNNSQEKQNFEIKFGDWIRTETGAHQYFEPNTKPFSCASWLKVNKTFLELLPGASEELIVTLQAPENEEDLEKMKWAMIFIQGALIKKPEENNGTLKAMINEIVRVGVHVYQTPFNLEHQSLKALNLNPSKTEGFVYDFLVHNEGNTMLTVKAHVELTNITTGEEIVSPKAEIPVFPGGKRNIELEIPKTLKKGKYSLLAVADYGEANPLEAIEKIIEIK